MLATLSVLRALGACEVSVSEAKTEGDVLMHEVTAPYQTGTLPVPKDAKPAASRQSSAVPEPRNLFRLRQLNLPVRPSSFRRVERSCKFFRAHQKSAPVW